MAAALALAIGAALVWRFAATTWVLEGLFFSALMAVIFGNFCAGSHVYTLLR
jgi:hypothetical protein